MKHIKFQSELLKACEKRDGWKHSRFPFMYYKDEETTAITDGKFVLFIPNKQFYLDTDIVFNCSPAYGLEKFKEFYPCTVENTKIQKVLDKDLTVSVFKCKDEEIYIDVKYLKYFDLEKSTFKGVNAKSPVQIFENDILVGLVLPVNINRKECI